MGEGGPQKLLDAKLQPASGRQGDVLVHPPSLDTWSGLFTLAMQGLQEAT